jgi:hypothetical protein
MQTLIFNTTKKEVMVKNGDTIMFVFLNVPTVKPMESGYYEVYQKSEDFDGNTSTVPVFRAPIANTNMIIQK